MKTFLATLALLSTFLAMPGCHSSPGPVPPAPDATDGAAPPFPGSDSCSLSCAAAQAVGCPEGQFSDCATVCNTALGDPGMIHPNTSCLMSAKSQAAVRACGWACKLDGG